MVIGLGYVIWWLLSSSNAQIVVSIRPMSWDYLFTPRALQCKHFNPIPLRKRRKKKKKMVHDDSREMEPCVSLRWHLCNKPIGQSNRRLVHLSQCSLHFFLLIFFYAWYRRWWARRGVDRSFLPWFTCCLHTFLFSDPILIDISLMSKLPQPA